MQTFYILTDLGVGESGKGAAIEWLCRLFRRLGYLIVAIVRTGGSQAAHHVVFLDGTFFMFGQFNSGTLLGVPTHLSEWMTIEPFALFNEGEELEKKYGIDAFSLITISERCLVVTPFHRAMSRLRELLRGTNRHGTVGTGVGETIEDSHRYPELAIRAGDFRRPDAIRSKLEDIRQLKLAEISRLVAQVSQKKMPEVWEKEMSILNDPNLVEHSTQAFGCLPDLIKLVNDDYFGWLLSQPGVVLVEPSHGAPLHPRYGFVPHVTDVDPTSAGLLARLKEVNYPGKLIRLGLLRCFTTRKGYGPLVTKDPLMTATFHRDHNNTEGNAWRGPFVNGPLDLVMLQYSIAICGGPSAFDGLVMSYLDALAGYYRWPVCEAYVYDGAAHNLDEFFVIEDGKIVQIKVHTDRGDEAHLRHQESLTRHLANCRPVLTELVTNDGRSLEQVLLDRVATTLGVPIVATAHGPTAEDRHIVPGWENLFS